MNETRTFDLNVRGEIPAALDGYLVTAASRRHKDRSVFSRWQDSQADLLRLDLRPGRPGRVQVTVAAVDPTARSLGSGFEPTPYEESAAAHDPAYGYATQPNHAINVSGRTGWATNLLFGAPLEFDLDDWKPRRIVRCVDPDEDAPRTSGTSHFAWSRDGSRAYFHQSLLGRERSGQPVEAVDLRLVELDVATGATRSWPIVAPPGDDRLDAANFHSAFWFEEGGAAWVGLLRTGAVIGSLTPHDHPFSGEHDVVPSPASEIWLVKLHPADAPSREPLRAELVPGIAALGAVALSHLDLDPSIDDGFLLYASAKQADVAEETHGENLYGDRQHEIAELYAGAIAEPFNIGKVLRVERRAGATHVRFFEQAYDPGRTSRGHSWLPINVQLDASRRDVFCSFGGLHPRLVPRHVAAAYGDRVADLSKVRYIPPLLLRLDADTMTPTADGGRTHLSYAEPVAFYVVGDTESGFVCTFSPETGLRIYHAGDLGRMVGHAVSGELEHVSDTHFRPDSAHLQFVPR